MIVCHTTAVGEVIAPFSFYIVKQLRDTCNILFNMILGLFRMSGTKQHRKPTITESLVEIFFYKKMLLCIRDYSIVK